MEDGSSYRVFELPKESPDDGDRTLVNNLANGLASPHGWHDTDGAAGAEFTRLQRYTCLWETEESWAGTCRQLIVTLADGTQHRGSCRRPSRDLGQRS